MEPHTDQLAEWLELSLEHLGRDVQADGVGAFCELQRRFHRAQHCLSLLDRMAGRPDPAEGKHWSALTTETGALDFASIGEAPACLGRFEILREIGRGGHGIVYLAIDPVLGRQVALKVPRPETIASADLRSRFLREARTVAELNHPHLISVLEVGELGPTCYIVQQYCPGPTLSTWMREQPHLPVPRAAATIVKVLAEAVHYVHSHGVVHRDIKPGNILLADLPEGRIGERKDHSCVPFVPKLTDFGLARLIDESHGTRTGTLLGTPAYMAPEQALGKLDSIGPATDVYGLGGVLFELLTGQPPVGRVQEAEAARRAAAGDITPPRQLSPKVPRDLEAVCMRCLEHDPSRRYPSADALARDLGRFADQEPVSVRRLTVVSRCWRWCRRKPVIAALLAALLVSVSLGLTFGAWQWHAAVRHRGQAEANFRQAHQAVQGFHDVLFGDDAYDAPAIQPLRRELMQIALEYQRDFAGQRSGDATLTANLADALYQLGFVSQTLGDDRAAIAYYSEAIPLWEWLRNEQPDRVEHALFLAKSSSHLGQALLGVGRHDDARLAYQRELAASEDFSLLERDEIIGKRRLARSYRSLGDFESFIGNADAAADWYLRSRDIFEDVVRRTPDDTAIRREFAKLLTALANRESRRHGLADAETTFGNARRILRQLSREGHELPGSRYDLAVLDHVQATCLARLGQNAGALELHLSADAILTQLAEEHPSIHRYGWKRAENQLWIANLLLEQGQFEEATRHLEECIGILSDLDHRIPGNTQTLLSLAAASSQLGMIYNQISPPEDEETGFALLYYQKAEAAYKTLMQQEPIPKGVTTGLASVRGRIAELKE